MKQIEAAEKRTLGRQLAPPIPTLEDVYQQVRHVTIMIRRISGNGHTSQGPTTFLFLEIGTPAKS